LVSPASANIETSIDIDGILRQFVELHASDLHLKIGRPPVFRLTTGLKPDLDSRPLTAQSLEFVFLHLTTEAQRTQFATAHSLDFAYSITGLARFRVSAIRQRGSLSLAIRHVPHEIPPMEQLGLPPVCQQLILRPRGLILVTGPAGSGKSTTLAAMIEYLNQRESRSVITVEDPIEFLFQDKQCLIHQRDLGDDCPSFAQGLTDALRHDPDVIVIGEMRDLDTISTAMTAAETGHLVLGTLHTIDAAQSVDRIVDMFPFGQQRQIRLQLSQVIEGVLSQALLPQIGGGRVAAFEVMLGTSVIRRLIRDEKIYEIAANIEMGRLEGMQTLDQALADLVRAERITTDDAVSKSANPRKLAELVRSSSTGSYNFQAAGVRSR
jgi:twitching motility protein PilT